MTRRFLQRSASNPAASRPTAFGQLNVVLLIKTNVGGAWIIPQIQVLQKRGHRVTVILPPGNGRLRQSLDRKGIDAIDSPFDFAFSPRLRTLSGLLRLRRLLRVIDADVVFYHLYASALAGRLTTVGSGSRRVHMVAGPLYLESRAIRTFERVAARLDDRIICGSEYTRTAYRSLGVRQDHLAAVPYGVATDHFVPRDSVARSAARLQLGLPPDSFVVTMIAYVYAPKRLVHTGVGIKGHEVLLEAWKSFRQGRPDGRLLLVGSGFDEEGEAYRARMRIDFAVDAPDSGIVWLDSIDDVRAAYTAADLSVCPSLSENHGAALESGAMGLPLIVTDAGGLPETISRESGWLVERGNASQIARAMSEAYSEFQAGTLASRGLASRQHIVSRFDQLICSDEVADEIERVARVRGPRHPRRLHQPVWNTVRDYSSPRLAIFTEARFGTAENGDIEAQDEANGARSWSPYLEHGSLTIVGRLDRRPGSGGSTLGTVRVHGLPNYQGPRGLLMNLPATIRSTLSAVREADEMIVRVPGAIGSAAAVSARLLRRPYSVEVVGDPYEVLQGGTVGRLGVFSAPVVARFYRWQVRHAAAALYVTQHALQAAYPAGEGRPTAAVSRVVLEPSDFVPGPKERRTGSFGIVAVGSHEQLYKGHGVLLHAVAAVRGQGLDVTATIVGRGRRQPELIALRDELGLKDAVVFVGHIDDRAALHRVLDDAALFAMPSLTEGLPRALIEAMARALPAVGSRIGGIPELLSEDALVAPGDVGGLATAISRFAQDDAFWRHHSALNLRRAQEYRHDKLSEARQVWLGRAFTG